MSCTSPLYRIPCSSFNFGLLSSRDQNRVHNHGVFLKWDAVRDYSSLPLWRIDDVQIIRCGQCIDCRLNYSRDWAIRCSLEASLHEHNYFVTLTYDDFHLPSGEYIDYKGDIFDSTLRRSDIQLFIKKYREYERLENGNTGIKVFYCGEYGGLTFRPHYHLCLFGASEIPDLRFGFRKKNFNYYKSSIFEDCWAPGRSSITRGFVDISDVSFDSIAYTARYCLKKQQGKLKKEFLDYYEGLDPSSRPELRTQPFVGMSLKPAIASEFYEKNKLQIREEDLVKYQKKYKLFLSRPPRYFDKLFEREDPEGYDALKRSRASRGVEAKKARYRLFSEDEQARLRREAEILQDKERRYYYRGL